MKFRPHHILGFLILALLSVTSIVSAQQPERWAQTNTTKTYLKKFKIPAGDTLWIARPMVEVERRVSLSDTAGLEWDSYHTYLAKDYVLKGTEKYLGKKINLASLELDSITENKLLREAQVLFSLAEDKLEGVFLLSEKVLQALRSKGAKHLLLVDVYWEYYDKKLYTKVSHLVQTHSGTRTSRPYWTCFMITRMAYIDLLQNQVSYYDAYRTTPANEPPYGYVSTQSHVYFQDGQNMIINFGLKAVYRGFSDKIGRGN